MPERLPQRGLGDYLPIAIVILVTVVLGVSALSLAFFAGQQSTLQPCLALALDSMLEKSDSLVQLLQRGKR